MYGNFLQQQEETNTALCSKNYSGKDSQEAKKNKFKMP